MRASSSSSLSFLLSSSLFFVGAVLAQDTLDSAIKATGRQYFGTCADQTTLSDASYEALVIEQFGAVTPENSMKWDATEPSQNSFSFDGADYLVDWAETNDKLVRGHTLVWHSQLPSWVSAITDAAELTSVIENHVTTIVSRYAGKIYAWDVVNEIFNDDGTLRDSVFSQVLNDTFVSIAFNAAAAADPSAKLYINDYNLDYSGAKVDAMVSLVQGLIADGVKVDGIGSQSHLVLDNGAIPYLSQPLQALADAGVDVALTELDIRMQTPSNSTSLADQQSNYQSAVGACADVTACVGVTVWGVTDKYSWVPDTFSGYGAALLYDEDYEAKPAYDGALAALAS